MNARGEGIDLCFRETSLTAEWKWEWRTERRESRKEATSILVIETKIMKPKVGKNREKWVSSTDVLKQ